MNTVAIVARLMLYAGVTMVIGSVGARWMESPSLPARESPPASRQGMWAWTVVLVALLVLFVMQFLALELAPTAQDVAMLLRQTAWGHGWLILAGAALMGALAHLARLPLLLRTVAVAGVALAMGGLGHAAADESLMIGRSLDAIHVAGMGVWIGTLLCAPISPSAQWWTRFSRTATAAAALVVLTGVGAAFRRVGMASISDIVSSDYGRLLLAKTLIVLGILALGARHRRNVIAQAAPSRGSVRTELALAALVLIVTAVLTGTAPPGE